MGPLSGITDGMGSDQMSEEDDIDREARKLREWLSSREGRRAMERARKKSEAGAAKRAEARRVDPKRMDEPVSDLKTTRRGPIKLPERKENDT